MEAALGPGGAAPGAALVAPLDPLAWDRDLLRSLFGFDYVWEVYVPAAKRRWGYYVLPVLFGDRLVGRIEPRIDRAARRIRILGAWWEDGFDPLAEPGFVPAFAGTLRDYAAFGGATAVTWPRTRSARMLGRAVSDAVGAAGARGVRPAAGARDMAGGRGTQPAAGARDTQPAAGARDTTLAARPRSTADPT